MLICEECGHGYPDKSANCTWCGSPCLFAHTRTITSIVDTECYPNYWLCAFSTGERFQMTRDTPLDIDGLRKALSLYTVVTFNGNGYDMPIIALALAGHGTDDLHRATEMIIVGKQTGWQLLKQRGLKPLYWIDHIDMINVSPGQSSLKAYGGKMHTHEIRDLPYTPGVEVNWYQVVNLRDYCDIDLKVTGELHGRFTSQLKMRVEMGEELGIDLRSKSDPQIAEAVVKASLPMLIPMPPGGWSVNPGAKFYYQPPDWLRFQNWDLVEMVTSQPFEISESGGVLMPPHLDGVLFHGYQLGIGGLHSTESCCYHLADDSTLLIDFDVASYYPSLILRTSIYPKQIGPAFSTLYQEWFDSRLAAKRKAAALTKEIKSGLVDPDLIAEKEKERDEYAKIADSKKLLVNGSFGKLGSKYSIFYAPSEMIQVTVTGQLALLMLIEMFELCGINVVSANTDGVLIKCKRNMEARAKEIVAWWESVTQFSMERTDYSAVYSRDVNSYVAVCLDGKVKCKGAFGSPNPGAGGWSNPTGQICVTAMIDYLTKGIHPMETIRGCTDIKQFVYVCAVRGGGSLLNGKLLPKHTSLKRMREITGIGLGVGKTELMVAYEKLRIEQQSTKRYLGKVVRWYFASGSTKCIVYSVSGNKVPGAVGVAEIMTLPDTLPNDIDYDKYYSNTIKLLNSVGIK